MNTLEIYTGPIDGRDSEEMDKILSDLLAAVDGLPITFRVVPFDSPTICVYGPYGEPLGTLMWMTDSLDEPEVYEWWKISAPQVNLSHHGVNARAALASM